MKCLHCKPQKTSLPSEEWCLLKCCVIGSWLSPASFEPMSTIATHHIHDAKSYGPVRDVSRRYDNIPPFSTNSVQLYPRRYVNRLLCHHTTPPPSDQSIPITFDTHIRAYNIYWISSAYMPYKCLYLLSHWTHWRRLYHQARRGFEITKMQKFLQGLLSSSHIQR